MMRSRKLLVLLVATAAWGWAADVPLRIKCDATCVAENPVLTMRTGDRVVVTSEKKWTCSIFTHEKLASPLDGSTCAAWGKELQGTVAPALIFETGSDKKEQVVVQLRMAGEEAAASGMAAMVPKVVAMSSLVFSVASVALGLFVFLGSRKPERTMAEWENNLQNKIGQMKVTTQHVSAALNFEPIGGGSPRGVMGRPSQATPPPAAPMAAAPIPKAVPQPAPAQISQHFKQPTGFDRFMAALDEWSQYPTPTPPEIIRSRQSLMALGGQSGASDLVQTIIEVAIRTTDCDLDPDHRDEFQQRALNQLIASAGLTVVFPKQFDPVDPHRHTVLSKQAAPSAQHRQKVAEVVRRGFERNGKIIRKAEVRVFD